MGTNRTNPALTGACVYKSLLKKKILTTSDVEAISGTGRRNCRQLMAALCELDDVEAGPKHGQESSIALVVDASTTPDRSLGIAMALGRELLRPWRHTELGDAYGEMVDHAATSAWSQKLHVRYPGGTDFAGLAGTLDVIFRALEEERWLVYDYERADGTVQNYRVQPLSLVIYGERTYLVARNDDRPYPRQFAVPTIFAPELAEPFDYPADWDPEVYFGPFFGCFVTLEPATEVVVMFPSRHRHLMMRAKMHETQRAKMVGDQVEVRWTVPWTPELERFVEGYGGARLA